MKWIVTCAVMLLCWSAQASARPCAPLDFYCLSRTQGLAEPGYEPPAPPLRPSMHGDAAETYGSRPSQPTFGSDLEWPAETSGPSFGLPPSLQTFGGTSSPTLGTMTPSRSVTIDSVPISELAWPSLIPVRDFLAAAQIPPAGVGAYGLVVFKSKATDANRKKLLMICTSFVAHFARNNSIPASVPMNDRMMTVWPLDNPQAPEASNDDCSFAVEHYDLFAAETAIIDARRQQANFDGEGPYLVGWSPSDTRGKLGKLVLLVDMSAANSQSMIDHQFEFWKDKIVGDPALWRSGFSLERLREAIKIFSDQYGSDIVDSIKLAGAF
jgi:hypothetical protein